MRLLALDSSFRRSSRAIQSNTGFICFWKSVGNGMPISAVVGKAKYMKEMNDIFYSTTFAGEALSICAAITVIKKCKNSVTKTLWEKGKLLNNKIQSIITKLKLDDVIKIKGFDPWKIVMYSDFKNVEKEYIKTFIIKNAFSRNTCQFITM